MEIYLLFSEAQDLKLDWRRGCLIGFLGLNNYDLDFESVQRGNPEMAKGTRSYKFLCHVRRKGKFN